MRLIGIIILSFLLSCSSDMNEIPFDVAINYNEGPGCRCSYSFFCHQNMMIVHSSSESYTDTFKISPLFCDTLHQFIDSIIVENNYQMEIDSAHGTDPTNVCILYKENDSTKRILFRGHWGYKSLLRQMNPVALSLIEMLERKTQKSICDRRRKK